MSTELTVGPGASGVRLRVDNLGGGGSFLGNYNYNCGFGASNQNYAACVASADD